MNRHSNTMPPAALLGWQGCFNMFWMAVPMSWGIGMGGGGGSEEICQLNI